MVYVETSAKPARRSGTTEQKLALLLSAMRHDAVTRGSKGHPVLYRGSGPVVSYATLSSITRCELPSSG